MISAASAATTPRSSCGRASSATRAGVIGWAGAGCSTVESEHLVHRFVQPVPRAGGPGRGVHLLHGDDAVSPGSQGHGTHSPVHRGRRCGGVETSMPTTRSADAVLPEGAGVGTRSTRSRCQTAYGRRIVVRRAAPGALAATGRLAARGRLGHVDPTCGAGPIVFVDEVLAVYRRFGNWTRWPRIRTSAEQSGGRSPRSRPSSLCRADRRP